MRDYQGQPDSPKVEPLSLGKHQLSCSMGRVSGATALSSHLYAQQVVTEFHPATELAGGQCTPLILLAGR